MEKIDRFFVELNNRKNELNRKSRRECKLQPARRDPLVLGKVAHLAEVKDDDVARVLSWHMAGDMDCIVTMTTEKVGIDCVYIYLYYIYLFTFFFLPSVRSLLCLDFS